MGSLRLVCCFLFLAAIESSWGSPANNNVRAKPEGEDYLLPDTVIPSKYTIELTVGKDFYTTEKFTGKVEIEVDLTENTKSIKLHSLGIEYAENSEYTIEEDVDVGMITLTYKEELTKGPYVIKFPSFTGRLRTEDMYGFYLSSYEVTNGNVKTTEWVATTQFQATHARKVFPCFDEPKFKAVFDISINRPEGYNSLANTKLKETIPDGSGGYIDHYELTPIMSTYLIAFIVSKFKGYGQTLTGNSDLVYDVFCREEALPTAEYAYNVGPKILKVLDEYTGIKYYDMDATDKMHQVAVPDFAAGAMENWGLVTYRETALLWDPEESTANYKSRVATVIAHEFAHMWFGDMVTLQWWSYTWLNEGFARYLQYYITKEVETTWELEKLFVVEQQQSIFVSDALSSASALTSDAYSPEQINDKFASISYNKGASIIRMMNHIMGEEKFKLGIRTYLETNKYQNTVPKDLWDSLKTQIDTSLNLPAQFDVIMTTWTEQSGFPVVTVKMQGANAVLTQKQFLYKKENIDDSRSWYIPITYTTSHEKYFEKPVIGWLTTVNGEYVIPNILHGGTGWIVVNLKENGYYRVNYEDALWDQLEIGLKKEGFDSIDVINRAQIVDDVFNFARGGLVTYGRALDVTSYLQNEVEYYPWYSAFSAFSYIRKRRGHSDNLETHIREMMSKLYDSVSFDISNNDPYIEVLKSVLTLQWSCDLGIEDCTERADALFNEYKDNNKKIDSNLRSVVYCSALRQSSNKEDWDFLWQTFKDTTLATEQVTILNALGCTKDEEILHDYLIKSITKDSGIRKQDARSVFNAVLAGNSNGVNVAYKFFTENLQQLSDYYGGMNDLSSIINNMADRFTTDEQIDQFESFVKNNEELIKEGIEQMASAIENARVNVQWAQAELDDWLDAIYGSATSLTLNISMCILILISSLYNIMW